MNILTGLSHLLFNQKEFFEHDAPKGIKLPLLITVIYSFVAILSTLPAVSGLMTSVPDGLGGVIIVTSVVSTVITILISWLIVALIFFALVKIIGYATCSYKDVLGVTGYVSALLIIYSLITYLVSFIGTPNTLVTLILSGVFLLWSIPVWYFGLLSVCGDIPRKKIIISIAIPVIIMVITSVVSYAMTLGVAAAV